MPKVIVRSIFDAFEYVMDHYYPYGLEEMVERSDSYVIISIQDSHTGGFGVTFSENKFCKGVLTLVFDDVIREVDGVVSFNFTMAQSIIEFVNAHLDVDTILVHCYAGQSRSRAVAAAIAKMLGKDNSKYFTEGSPNELVYNTLMKCIEE